MYVATWLTSGLSKYSVLEATKQIFMKMNDSSIDQSEERIPLKWVFLIITSRGGWSQFSLKVHFIIIHVCNILRLLTQQVDIVQPITNTLHQNW